MTHTLTAKEQSLAKIFSDDYVFTIPGYQRPYSWGTEQAQELLDDLLGALAVAPSQLSQATPYFLGTIVLIKGDSSPEATVVDGQQRLTTLTLLLSAIRATVISPEVQADITSCIYAKGSLVTQTLPRYRLSLRDRDLEFFRKNVQHEEGLQALIQLSTVLPGAQARLRANAKVFLNALAKLHQNEVMRLVQFIVTRCYLVTVATPDLDSAYRIFGVLNSRGLDLSATDILKAEIIGGVEPSLRDSYTKKWEDEEEDLGRDEFNELFGHIRMIYRKAKPQGTLLKEFKEHVAPAERPQFFVDEILLPMAQAFSELRQADYASQRHAEQVNECLRWLNRLEFKDWLPPAIAYWVRFRQEPDAVVHFVRDLERLGYSMLARKCGVNERLERFSSLTLAIETGKELFVDGSPLQLAPNEQQQTYAALSGPLYDTHSSRALAVLLLRLDQLMSDGTASYKHDVVSVEHVMPQQPAPNSQWRTWVPTSASHQHWVHRLGNLALLSRKKNSSASNRDFNWKKTAYFTKGGISSFALTTQVLQHVEWTVDVMERRQADMLKAFENHLRLHGRKSNVDVAEALLAELSQGDDVVLFELESSKHELSAAAREDGNVFTVLEGSQAKVAWPGAPHSYMYLREELVASGALKLSENGNCLVFSKDVEFKSPSAASATVLGRTDNGRNSWRLKGTSITYAAWEEALPQNRSTTGRTETFDS